MRMAIYICLRRDGSINVASNGVIHAVLTWCTSVKWVKVTVIGLEQRDQRDVGLDWAHYAKVTSTSPSVRARLTEWYTSSWLELGLESS